MASEPDHLDRMNQGPQPKTPEVRYPTMSPSKQILVLVLLSTKFQQIYHSLYLQSATRCWTNTQFSDTFQALPNLGWQIITAYFIPPKWLKNTWFLQVLTFLACFHNTSIRALTMCSLPMAISYDISLNKLLASQTILVFTSVFHVPSTRRWVLWRQAFSKASLIIYSLSHRLRCCFCDY